MNPMQELHFALEAIRDDRKIVKEKLLDAIENEERFCPHTKEVARDLVENVFAE